MNLSNPLDALEYIRAKLRDWTNVPKQLESLIIRAGSAQARARVEGKPALADQAGQVIVSAGELLTTYTHLSEKVDRVKSWLRSVGLLSGYDRAVLGQLPLIPVVLVAVVVAVAAGMYLVYKGLAYNEALLRDVESGLLPTTVLPGGDGKPPGGGGFFDDLAKALGGTAGLVLGGGALFLLLAARRERQPAA